MNNVPEKSCNEYDRPWFWVVEQWIQGFVKGSALWTSTNAPVRNNRLYKVLVKQLDSLPEVRMFPMQDQTIQVGRRGGSQPVQFVIQNNDFEKIREALPRFLAEVQQSKILQNADSDLKFNKPELHINIDRLKASELGVSIEIFQKRFS